MADDITDVYIATEAGDAGWQSLTELAAEQVDVELPISSSDGTVVLDSPAANTFTISTGGTERVIVASEGQVLVGLDAVENANFNMHVAGDDNVQICIDATDVSATTGAVLKLRCGNNKYWNFQHAQNVDGSLEKNQFIITNGSGTFLRGYQDNTAFFSGDIRTSRIAGPAANDASIELGPNLTLDNKSGIIWLGSSKDAPAGTTNLLVGDSEGDGKNLLISSGQPKTAGEAGSAISFATAAGNGDRARRTRMYIDPEGNVGIDNVAPDEKLVVGNGRIASSGFCGYDATSCLIDLTAQNAQVLRKDGSDYTPTQPNSIATKKTVDDKIWVGSTAEYQALATKNPETLYCLTD